MTENYRNDLARNVFLSGETYIYIYIYACMDLYIGEREVWSGDVFLVIRLLRISGATAQDTNYGQIRNR